MRYGINTGFGLFSNVTIAGDQLERLQVNLIRSHAAGTGAPLSLQRTRLLLALRINVLAKGYSGISLKVVEQMVDAFNSGCLSVVPSKGTQYVPSLCGAINRYEHNLFAM